MNKENYNKGGRLFDLIELHQKSLEMFKDVSDKGRNNPDEILKVEMRGSLSPYVEGTDEHLGGYIRIPSELVPDFLEQIRQYHIDNQLKLEKELEAL